MPSRFRSFVSVLFALAAVGCTPSPGEDAGPTPESDAGPGTDAGEPDGGAPDPCVGATYDPVLGTLSVAAGYEVVDDAPLPENIVAVGTGPVEGGTGYQVYAGNAVSLSVLDLGVWPDLTAGSELYSVVPDDVAPDDAFLSPFLVVGTIAGDGFVAAGYTQAFDADTGQAPGALTVYDGGRTFIDAPNNYSGGTFAETHFVVNAAGADTTTGDNGIYAVGPDGTSYQAASFDSGWMASNGFTAVAGGLVVTGGFFDDGTSGPANHLFALPIADVAAAENDGAIDLAQAEEVAVGALSAAAGFGDDLAVIRGDFFVPLEGVERISLAQGADRTPEPVLEASDDCTIVDVLASMGDDLLVGVQDPNGRRLLQVRATN